MIMSLEQNVYNFPYQPYAQQIKLMNEVHNTIENGKIGIFESPTGTGKSLSILCSTLDWLLKNQEKEIDQLMKHKLDIKAAENKVNLETDWVQAFDAKQKLNLKLTNEIENLEKKKQIIDKIKSIKSKKNLSAKNSTDKIPFDNTSQSHEFCEEFLVSYDSDNQDYDDDDKENEGSITKILYCSRTHSQLSQVQKELLKTNYHQKIVTCSLGSRQNLCINPSVNHLKSINFINEKCLELQKPAGSTTKNSSKQCPFKSLSKIQSVSHEIIQSCHDIEELVKVGSRVGGCPFYGTRATIAQAHLVLLPYQNLLNRAARMATQIELAGNVVVIDEAHNLPDTICSVNSETITVLEIQQARHQLTWYISRYLERLSTRNLWYLRQLLAVVNCLHEFVSGGPECDRKGKEINPVTSVSCVEFVFQARLEPFQLDRLVRYLDQSRLAFKLIGGLVRETAVESVVTSKKRRFGLTQTDDGLSCSSKSARQSEGEFNGTPDSSANPILAVKNFLTAVLFSLDGRVLVETGRALTFLVVDPGKYLREIVEQSRSVIVLGGTMQPFSEFTDRLFRVAGCPIERMRTFSCDHVIDASTRMRIVTLDSGHTGKPFRFTFEHRNDPDLIVETGELIRSVLSICPNGVVIFFPSYGLMNYIVEAWRSSGLLATIETIKSIFIESKLATVSEQIMRNYCLKSRTSKGAVLFAVIGAKMSEGINFGDELARLVVVIGVPYPQVKSPVLMEKKKFLEQHYGAEVARTMYENLAMKAVNQAIGRAIRHINDYAGVLLLDARYASIARISGQTDNQSGKLGLPHWMMSAVSIQSNVDVALSELKSFFANMTSK